MEEILASIRRIIADDDASKSAVRLPEPLKAVARAPALPRSSPPAPRAKPLKPPPHRTATPHRKPMKKVLITACDQDLSFQVIASSVRYRVHFVKSM